MAANEQIEKACTTFEQSIRKLISSHSKLSEHDQQLQTQCVHYVHHANHVLRTLVAKRTSLEYALKAFKECSNDYVQVFSKLQKRDEEKQRVLTRWFTHFLRLRDGFQLLESGECRHEHDAELTGARGKFKSRLSGALRKDGVTRKFKSQLGYTGFGYDEWNDPDVGIKNVLLDTLITLTGRKGKSEDIIGRWEESMDHHETQRNLLNKEMNDIYKSFVSRMNQLLASRGENKLTLKADDKGERLTWGMLDIKRSGNKFAISNAGGSIPIGLTLSDWEEKFALEPPEQDTQSNKASTKPMNKRRIIADSSDEEDDAPKKQPTSKLLSPAKQHEHNSGNGLDVVMREATDVMENVNLGTNGKSSSLDEIKRQHGVSARQLEKGWDKLDDENRTTSMAACTDELNEVIKETFGNESSVLGECLEQWKRVQSHKYLPIEYSLQEFQEELKDKLTRWQRKGEQLSRVKIGKWHLDADELYAAQENYREANMELGILFLDIHNFLAGQLDEFRHNKEEEKVPSSLKQNISDSDNLFLQAAEEVFRKSLKLVTDMMSSERNTTLSVQKQWEKGQHLLLRGRAQLNIGISLLQLSQYDREANKRRSMLIDAVLMFENALKSTSQMRNNTVLIQKNPAWKDKAMTHNLEAIELSAHAAEELGKGRWKLNRFDDSKHAFFQAANTEQVLELERCEGVTVLQLAKLLCNAYHSVMVLAEMSGLELDKTPSKDETRGEMFLRITCHALQRAMKISEVISAFAAKHLISCDENFSAIYDNVAKSDDLKAEEEAIGELWESKLKSFPKGSETDVLSRSHLSAQQNTNRGELQLDQQRLTQLPDRRRILIFEGSTSTRRKRCTKKSITNKRRNVSESFHSAFVDSEGTPAHNLHGKEESTQYLPWGDDVLQDEDRNKYPACCPPLPPDVPPDIRRAIEARLASVGIAIGNR